MKEKIIEILTQYERDGDYLKMKHGLLAMYDTAAVMPDKCPHPPLCVTHYTNSSWCTLCKSYITLPYKTNEKTTNATGV